MVGKGGEKNESGKQTKRQAPNGATSDVDDPADGGYLAGTRLDGAAMGRQQGLPRHPPGGKGHPDSTGGHVGMAAGARFIGQSVKK